MEFFDFDKKVQKEFNNTFADIPSLDWKRWLKIASIDEFESLALKLSDLDKVNLLFNRIKKEKTESRSFSVNLKTYIEDYHGTDPLIMIHTSGTTGSSITGIKWFHMTKSTIQRLWAPGMRAIFESSGLSSKNSAVIFVPSRLKHDGINESNNSQYISLYSSEFSQRIMVSAIKPISYLLYEYKNSKNLEIISKILSLENLSVISAPAATILGWANIEKFRTGLRKSLGNVPKNPSPMLEKLLKIIHSKGIDNASKKIQNLLSEKVSKATLIFSISSLNALQWDSIRKFMNWDKGKENFTNLYVGSEIGPFASSLGDLEIARSNKMYIFPLTVPALEYRKEIDLLTRTQNKIGKLLISRFNNEHPLINIDTGDIVILDHQKNIPLIGGDIYRAGFHLKYPIKISSKIKVPENSNIYAGDFFTLKGFDILAPRYLLDCLINNCKLQIDSLLIVPTTDSNRSLSLVLPSNKETTCKNLDEVIETINDCPRNIEIKKAIQNKKLKLKLIDEQPVDFMATRSQILSKVQKGDIPKGILKRWSLYMVVPASISEDFIY